MEHTLFNSDIGDDIFGFSWYAFSDFYASFALSFFFTRLYCDSSRHKPIVAKARWSFGFSGFSALITCQSSSRMRTICIWKLHDSQLLLFSRTKESFETSAILYPLALYFFRRSVCRKKPHRPHKLLPAKTESLLRFPIIHWAHDLLELGRQWEYHSFGCVNKTRFQLTTEGKTTLMKKTLTVRIKFKNRMKLLDHFYSGRPVSS